MSSESIEGRFLIVELIDQLLNLRSYLYRSLFFVAVSVQLLFPTFFLSSIAIAETLEFGCDSGGLSYPG